MFASAGDDGIVRMYAPPICKKSVFDVPELTSVLKMVQRIGAPFAKALRVSKSIV